MIPQLVILSGRNDESIYYGDSTPVDSLVQGVISKVPGGIFVDVGLNILS